MFQFLKIQINFLNIFNFFIELEVFHETIIFIFFKIKFADKFYFFYRVKDKGHIDC